jgi:BMFP domain-containing protein YqiC
MLVERAVRVQIPCHREFQCSFHGLRVEAPRLRTVLELVFKPLRHIGALYCEVDHVNTLRIDEIARRLLESVPPGWIRLQADLESNFRAVLRASLSKLDLVARDEFDAQVRVLERTRARLEELEKRVNELEGAAKPVTGAAPGGPSG